MLSHFLRVVVLGLLGVLGQVSAAHAVACGSDVSVTSGPVTGSYDPFSPTPVTFGGVALTFTRAIAASGGGKTQSMAFYMVQPAGSPAGNQVIWPDTSQNILFTTGGPAPTLNSPPNSSQPAGVALVSWGGGGQPDTIVKTVQVSLAPGFDPVAQPTIDFDLVFVCQGTGGYTDITTGTLKAGVVHIAIQVRSGLQVSYAGPALDFGDISDLTSGGLLRSGLFHIRSSGAYSVAVSSGNHYLMTYPGGPSTSPNPGTVGYSLNFLGQTRQYGNESFALTTCRRAGVQAVQHIPMSVTLQEGGVGKTPSPSYADTISVTFSPIADPGLTQSICSSPP